MKKLFIIFLMILFIVGCTATAVNIPKVILTEEQCKNADVICWGQRGENPIDIDECYDVFACYDWELHAR